MHRLGEPSCEPPFLHFLEAQYSLPFIELCSQTNFTLPQSQQPTDLLNGLIVKLTQMCRPLGTSVNQMLPLYRPSAVRSSMRTRPRSWTRKSCPRNSHNHKWYTDSPLFTCYPTSHEYKRVPIASNEAEPGYPLITLSSI